MSCTIIPNNKDVEWSTNSSGWRLCGFIHMISHVPVYIEDGFEATKGDKVHSPRPPDDATAKQASTWAEHIEIRLISSDFAKDRRSALSAKGLLMGGDADMEQYVKDYVAFLKGCGGYELAG